MMYKLHQPRTLFGIRMDIRSEYIWVTHLGHASPISVPRILSLSTLNEIEDLVDNDIPNNSDSHLINVSAWGASDMPGKSKSRSGTSTPTGSTSGASRRENRRKRQASKRQNDTDAVIDLTNDDEEGDGGPENRAAQFFDGLKESPAGPSRSREDPDAGGVNTDSKSGGRLKSKKGKERANGPEASEPVPETPKAEPEPSTFKPLSRSIMSGWRLSPSRTPSPPPRKRSRTDSPSRIEIFVDEKPAPSAPSQAEDEDPADISNAVDLFSTSLIPSKRTKRTLRKEEEKKHQAQHVDTAADEENKTAEEKLLLPDHVVFETASGEATDASKEREPAVSEEGLHVLDDSQAKVSLFFRRQGALYICSTLHRGSLVTSILKLGQMKHPLFWLVQIRVESV